MPNIVYVLTNPAMPGMVKIGMTDRPDVQRRMNDLYTTGVPLPFECVIARQIEHREAAEIEKALHVAFGPYRINTSREFFEIDPEQVEALIQVMPGQDVTPRPNEQDAELQPEDREAVSEYKKRQTRLSEQEFMDSLDENGVRVYERVLALGKQKGMQITWGKTGFSLNAVSNGRPIVVCHCFQPHSVYRQSIYTNFSWMKRGRSNVPQDAIESLRTKALNTGLFGLAGGSGIEVHCRINRWLDESELAALTGWMDDVIGRIREFEDDISNQD